MSLASRVFMLFGTLMIIIMGSQWFMMRSITQEVSSDLGKVAFSVAKDTAAFFILGKLEWTTAQGNYRKPGQQEPTTIEERIDLNVENRRVIRMNTPSVEIRLNNQRTADHIQLITSTSTEEIPLPRKEIISTVERIERQMIISTLGILAVGLLIAAFLAHRLMLPIKQLTSAAQAVADGNLGTQIPAKQAFVSKELTSSIKTFNEMSLQLKEMQQKNQELQQNAHYKELGYISSGLAHSVRNPLNTLGLSIEQMSEHNLNENRRKQLISSAYRQIKRIDQWIKTFMTFALGADAETTDVAILDIIQNIQLEISQQRPDVQINVQVEPTLTINGIEVELHAVLHSLIINAVEASPEAGIVEVVASGSDSGIVINVTDHGEGIPESLRNDLFKPHKTTKAKGSGMGLFMAEKLASNRYQGAIKLDEQYTEGTRMALTLSEKRKV